MTADVDEGDRIVVVVVWRLAGVTAGAVRLGRLDSGNGGLWRCINGGG